MPGRRGESHSVPFLCGRVVGDAMGSKPGSLKGPGDTGVFLPPPCSSPGLGWAGPVGWEAPYPQAKGVLPQKGAESIGGGSSPKREGLLHSKEPFVSLGS